MDGGNPSGREIGFLWDAVKSAQEEAGRLSQNYAEAARRAGELNSRLAHLERSLQEARSRESALKAEIEKMRAGAAAREELVKRASGMLEGHAAMAERAEALAAELDSEKARASFLEGEKAALDKNLRGASARAGALEDRLKAIAAMKPIAEALEAAAAGREGSVSPEDLLRELADAGAKSSRLAAELESRSAEAAALGKETGALRREKEALEKSLERAAARAEELAGELAAARDSGRASALALAEAESALAETGKALAAAKTETEALRGKEKGLEALAAEREASAHALRMELRDARLSAEEEKVNFAGAVQKVFELQSRAAELRRGLEEALEKEKFLAEQLRDSRAETEKLNALLRDAKTGLSLEKEMTRRSAARINALLAEGESLRDTLRKADENLRDAIKKLHDRDASIALLKQELGKIDRLQEEVEDLKRKNMRLSGLIKREQFDFTEKIIKGLAKISGDLNLFSYRLPAAARKNLAPSLKAMLSSVTLMKGWQAYIDETPLNLERGELRATLDGLLDGWERPFRAKKLSLARQVILPSAWVKMDREKLRLAFYQVIKNAYEHLPPGTSLKTTLTGTEDRSKAVVIFEDNGHGLPAEVLDRLYLPFNTSRKDATGIGLATAHRIAERHGGEFTVSNRKERGAAAVFILPLDWGAVPPTEEPRVKEAPAGAPPPPPPPRA